MSPALNGSSAIRRFERSYVIEICDGIIFDFYTGRPHINGTFSNSCQYKGRLCCKQLNFVLLLNVEDVYCGVCAGYLLVMLYSSLLLSLIIHGCVQIIWYHQKVNCFVDLLMKTECIQLFYVMTCTDNVSNRHNIMTVHGQNMMYNLYNNLHLAGFCSKDHANILASILRSSLATFTFP